MKRLDQYLIFLKRTIKNHSSLTIIKIIQVIKKAPRKLNSFLLAKLISNAQKFLYGLEMPKSSDLFYSMWLFKNYPRRVDLETMSKVINLLNTYPKISIIMPVFNTSERFLKEAIESVINQIYPYWELCIVDNASSKDYIRPLLEKYATQDNRIKLVFNKINEQISECLNSALNIATGEYIALLDHDDLLTPDALYEVAFTLNNHPDIDMIYSDEDKIDDNNILQEPFFKPDWSPDSFLSRMYGYHLGVYRRTLAQTISGFRTGYEGSQDYDFVLRFTEKTDKIYHVTKILYHSRIHRKSIVKTIKTQNYALEASKNALEDALVRRQEPGKVIPISNGYNIIRYEIKKYEKVSIIIPSKNLSKILNRCLTSIFDKTEYPNFEVIVIDNGSDEEKVKDVVKTWKTKKPESFFCELLDIPFNFSKINNYAVKHTSGKYILFLNNDTEIINNDWLNAMVEQAQRPSIGAVGALLLYPDNTIQHAGIIMGLGGIANHSYRYYSFDSGGYFNQIQTINNYSALTAACLMCRREVFEEVGGFEEKLSVAFNDVDLCLKIVEKGYKNIYLPHVKLYHYESKTRGYENTISKQKRFEVESQYIKEKWRKYIDYDPCYNPNLTRKDEDYSIKIQD